MISPKRVLITVAAILTIEGAMMLVIPIVDILTKHEPSIPFLLIGATLLILGVYVQKYQYLESPTPFEALITASIVWLLMPLLSSIAMYFDFGMNIYDGFFESVSGFTGTGFTVIKDVEVLRPSILLWRSMMQWIGELGVVVLAVIILPQYNIISRVYLVERGKLAPTVIATAKIVATIYFALTALGIVLYMASGMTFFEAVNLIMTTIATGGMSIYNNSVVPVITRAPIAYITILVFMILGAQNFRDLKDLMSLHIGKLLKSAEFGANIAIMFILSGLLTLSLHYIDGYGILNSISNGIFHMVSGSTTTGFSTIDLGSLSDVSKALLIVGMFIGGSTFSTAGGIKVYRFIVALKNLFWAAATIAVKAPISIRKKVGLENVGDEAVLGILSFIVLYFFTDLFLSIAFSWVSGASFIDSLFEVTSALGCVGLSVGVVNYALSFWGKALIILGMYLGRLEFVQLYIILGYVFRRKSKVIV